MSPPNAVAEQLQLLVEAAVVLGEAVAEGLGALAALGGDLRQGQPHQHRVLGVAHRRLDVAFLGRDDVNDRRCGDFTDGVLEIGIRDGLQQHLDVEGE